MSATLLPVASGTQIRSWAMTALRQRWRTTLAAAAASVCESALGLVGPIAIGLIAEAIVDQRGTSAMIGPVIVLAVASVAGAAATWASGLLLARAVLPEVAALREQVVSSALTLPIDAVEAGGSGDLVSRVSGDVEQVSETAQGALGEFVSAGLTIVITLAGLAALDWRFALAGLLAVPVQAHTLRWYLRASHPIYAGGRIAEGRRTTAMLAAFGALPTLRALRHGEVASRQVRDSSAAAMRYDFDAIGVATRFYGRLNLAEFVGLSAILLVAYLLVSNDIATVGASTTAALFFAGLFDPINIALGVFDELQQAGAGLGRLIGVVSSTPARESSGTAVEGALDLGVDGVSFGYGEAPDVLHDVTVRIHPGEHVAVVGTTGSGKSTLASLLAGARMPRRGAITLAGVPLPDIDPVGLHRTIALVTQETHVFAGTIADNLRLASPDASSPELVRALHQVGAHGWVDTLPDALETRVGAGGHHLTASQAQHLALARLILLDPAIVILDEATAEAGSDAARGLDAAAENVLAGRTALIVAHRLSQAATADLILVLEDGVVIESGSHESLLRAAGAYAHLWSAWTLA